MRYLISTVLLTLFGACSRVPNPPAPSPLPESPQAPAPGTEDPQNESIPSFPVVPKSIKSVDHGLVAFVGRAEDFETRVAAKVTKEGPERPISFKATEDLVLYVLWGRRAGATVPRLVFDRHARKGVVTARWTGTWGMSGGSHYVGFGFSLGRLDSGDYAIEIQESTAVEKDGIRVTGTVAFRVVR